MIILNSINFSFYGFLSGVCGTADREAVEGVPGIPGDPGYLSLRFLNLRSQKVQDLLIPSKTGSFSFDLEKTHVDMKTGTLTIHETCADVVQNICLVFSTAVLQVLCQPRPNAVTSYKPIRSINSESLALVMAAGFKDDTPCNNYIETHMEEGRCASFVGYAGGCGGCDGCGAG